MDANLIFGTDKQISTNGQAPPSRRKLLGWLVAGINALVGVAVVGPVLGFIGSPLRKAKRPTWFAVLDESDLTEGQTKEVSFVATVQDGYGAVERKYTVFLRRFEDRVAAFDPSCTHLGCRITFQQDKKRYLCPCHGGVFDDAGRVISGPPPRPLEQHPVKVEGGKIWIQKNV